MLVHPVFDPSSLDSDIALLQLDSEFPFTDHTQLICLPDLQQESSLSLDCKVSLENRHAGKHSQKSVSVYKLFIYMYRTLI